MIVSLEEVKRLVVSSEQLLATRDFLRRMGEKRLEGLLVWAGVIQDGTCEIRSVIAPRQTSMATPSGLLLSLDETSLHELNQRLYESRLD